MHFTCILWNSGPLYFILLEILWPLLNIAFCQMAIPNKEQGLHKGVSSVKYIVDGTTSMFSMNTFWSTSF